MSKNRKTDLESEYKSKDKQETQEVLEFDLYFHKLIRKDNRIFAHHKAPMKQFAESLGARLATEAEFDEIFKNY